MRGGGVTFSIPNMVAVTLGMPFIGFMFSIGYTLLIDFDPKASTHCEVEEFLPSFSSVVGGSVPQKYIWNICIALHSAPRFLLSTLYKNLYEERLNMGSWTPLFIKLNYIMNITENFCLVGLSFVSSIEIYAIHKFCFVTFLITYCVSSMLQLYMVKHCGFQARCREEVLSYKYKKNIFFSSIFCLILSLYFFQRHNEYCEPYVYSFFGVFEYLVILGNMLHHGTAYYDFKDLVFTVTPGQLLVK